MSGSRRTICAIHQPNFFPWLGYFDKIVRADVFLLLDNVQFPKTAGTWINRVQLLSNNGPYWATASVDRKFHGTRLIRDSNFSPRELVWREKLRRSIMMRYSRAAHFAEIFPYIEPLLMFDDGNIAEYNINAIAGLCRLLGLDVEKLRRGSTLDVDGNSTTLLIRMCLAAGADAYMCGGGASSYQDDDAFREANIEVIYQNFKHPVYEQGEGGSFHAGLSVIDALMHCGVVGVRKMLGVDSGR
ncbi:WbqC family protein [Burkholderia multivorans]